MFGFFFSTELLKRRVKKSKNLQKIYKKNPNIFKICTKKNQTSSKIVQKKTLFH